MNRTRRFAVLALMLFGAIPSVARAGGVVGGVAGALLRTERWKRAAPLSMRAGLEAAR
jgi:hypothetical protein